MNPVAQLLGLEIDPEGDVTRALEAMSVDVRPFDKDVPVEALVANATIALMRDVPLTAETLSVAPELRLVQRVGVHMYGVDIDYCRRNGIYTAALPSWLIPGQAIAEHALFLMLATAKRYREARSKLEAGVAGLPLTVGLAGKTLGLLGLGRTAAPLIGMARAIGMNVIGIKNEVFPGLMDAMHLNWLGTPDQLHEFLPKCDFLSVHLPLGGATRGVLGASELAMLRDGAVLVNTSRAGIVDYDALLREAQSGRLGGIGLDVWWQEPVDPDDPLLRCPGVVVTPHHAGHVSGHHLGVARYVAENVRLVLAGETPRFLVGLE